MSRAFMPMYWGDYLRDTGHLTTEQHGAYLLLLAHCWQHGRIPEKPSERAAVAKLTVQRWRVISPPICLFFAPDGTHKRVAHEMAKADEISLKRQIIGQKGGMRSAIARAIGQAKGKQTPKQLVQQTPSKHPSKTEAIGSPSTKKDRIPSIAAREASAVNSEETPQSPGGSLATALPAGALRSPPDTEPAAPKRPQDVTRAELEAAFAARHNGKAPNPDGLDLPSFLARAVV